MENAPARRGRRPRMLKPEMGTAAEIEIDAGEEVMTETVQAPAKVMRPPMRKEYTLASAEERAAQLFNHAAEIVDGVDEFYIDRSRIPPGWDMEWKTKTVLGAEDPAQMVAYARTGWEPVPLHMFPEMMPAGWKGDTIERKGMILMMRPKRITDMVRQADARRAREQVNIRQSQLASAPEGQFGRDHAQVKPKISTGYEPMPIPKD